MAEIKITELRPTGSELFEDSETFLKELNDDEMTVTLGGGDSLISISADTVDKSFISVGGDVSISKQGSLMLELLSVKTAVICPNIWDK